MLDMKSKKSSLVTALGTRCNACDENFKSEADFKDHILTTIHKGPSDGTRNFNYRLTAKTAKSNLVKGALRNHIEVEHKQGATNIDFSDGAWILAVFPEVLNWDKGNRKFSYGDLNIQVIEAKPGIDGENKHMDYKIVFHVNGKKVVLHAYNSKQRFTISGQNYVNFVTKFLEPFLRKKIEGLIPDANKFNETVLKNLGRPVKRKNIKYKTSQPLSCNSCNQISNSVSQLHAHMKFTHELSLNMSIESGRYHSTKNNSKAESLMIEDSSLSVLLNDSIEDDVSRKQLILNIPTLEESVGEVENTMNTAVEKYKCDVWYKDNIPCVYESTTATDMLKHMKSDHIEVKKTGSKIEKIVDNKEVRKEVNKDERNECEKEERKEDSTEEKEVEMKEEIKEDIIVEKEVPKSHDLDIEREKFQCDICVIKFDSNHLLMNHVKSTHKQEPLEYVCSKCKYVSRTETGMKRHDNVFCDQCSICMPGNIEFDIHMRFHKICHSKNCDFRATIYTELKDHVLAAHGRTTCQLCREECENEEELKQHEQTHVHKKNAVGNGANVECEGDRKEVDDLKAHVKTIHEGGPSLKYTCNTCEYGSDYIAELWNHVLEVHPGSNFQFDNKVKKDILLNLVAEQNVDIMEEFNSLKKDIKEAFTQLAQDIGGSMRSIRDELNEKITAAQKETNNLVSKISNIENLVKYKREGTEGSKVPIVTPVHTEEEVISIKEVTKDRTKYRNSKQKSKHRVTWVGTSISKVLDREKFEKDVKVDLTVEKAYCIKEEGRFKKLNFAAIVPEIVNKGEVDTLVLQTGSIEITNVDVNKAMMDASKDLSEYKREWYSKAEEDSVNLFNIAEGAIARDPNLNVVIVKRLSRFDRTSSDISGIKTQLSKFANHVYDQLWLKRGSPDRIHIIELALGCDKYPHLRNIVYGKHNNPKYDGIHLTGDAAGRHFTYRAIQAIYPIISQPFQYTHRPTFSSVNSPTRISNNKVQRMPAERHDQDNYHRDCPQTRYQTQSTSGRRGGNKSSRSYSDVLTNRDHRYKDGNRAGCGKKKPELKQSRYEVPTHNRFAGLSDMYQGNY